VCPGDGFGEGALGPRAGSVGSNTRQPPASSRWRREPRARPSGRRRESRAKRMGVRDARTGRLDRPSHPSEALSLGSADEIGGRPAPFPNVRLRTSVRGAPGSRAGGTSTSCAASAAQIAGVPTRWRKHRSGRWRKLLAEGRTHQGGRALLEESQPRSPVRRRRAGRWVTSVTHGPSGCLEPSRASVEGTGASLGTPPLSGTGFPTATQTP
jgi:hypothetical protein